MMQVNGLKADAEFIGYDKVTQPDGLFICWSGQKKLAECAYSSSVSANTTESYQNERINDAWYEAFFNIVKSLASEKEVNYHELYWSKIYMPYYIPMVNQLFSKLPQSHYKMLDCGAGYGFWSSYFSELGHQVTAVDNSSDVLKVLNELSRTNSNICCENANLQNLNFDPNTFDITFSFSTLHILENPERGLLEMARVTKPDGYIVVCFGNPEHPLNKLYWQTSNRVKYVDSKMIQEKIQGIASPVFSLSSYAHDARLVAACSDIPLYQFEIFQKKASALKNKVFNCSEFFQNKELVKEL
jgi:ubiquinone/menaquinone biosynthesis C-methylase UbiE